ncbi:hypothetical protein [Streptomyces sp. WAC08241]|uniref:hypothetical protein n=1 Tax=Streptomyces sp. WAC08241 TaxID=2487421 RepID=UPI000F771A26|nr:hypothetical protein [Streptomyces sp. WAC08241]RSS44534.1 hypothetical protein EF906_06805 [Streptomyces sp. WAC08241]
MKKRHVRALAVFGIALVALTGARGSGGGGCGSHSGSSSSSGGGSHHDNDDNGSTSGGSVSGGSSGADKAIRDITIATCAYDAATKNLTARITVKNDGVLDYDYDVTLKFKGTSAVPATATTNDIAVAAGASRSVDLTTAYPGTGDGSEYTECEVTRASRS